MELLLGVYVHRALLLRVAVRGWGRQAVRLERPPRRGRTRGRRRHGWSWRAV